MSKALDPTVAIIVLNWNNYADTLECLESLYQIDYSNYYVIVVDNASRDGSIQKILQYAKGKYDIKSRLFEYNPGNKPINVVIYSREEAMRKNSVEGDILSLPSNKRLVLLVNEKNYGYAEGNNIAIRFALKAFDPQYVLLINNDVVVDKQFLAELVKAAERERKIGVVGPKIYYKAFLGRNDIINFAGEDIVLWKAKGIRYGFNEMDKGQYDRIKEVDKIDGACMLIKKQVFGDVGMFDPVFFMGWEETDFCLRAKKKGYKIIYVPTAKVWHKVSSSFGGIYNTNRIYYMTKNRFLFVKKNVYGFDRVRFLIYFFYWDIWLSMATFLKLRNIRAFLSFINGTRRGLSLLMQEGSKR